MQASHWIGILKAHGCIEGDRIKLGKLRSLSFYIGLETGLRIGDKPGEVVTFNDQYISSANGGGSTPTVYYHYIAWDAITQIYGY